MSKNTIYINASIGIKLPDNTPPEPESWGNEEYELWWEQYIEPTMTNLINNKMFEYVDIHDQEVEIGS